VAWLNYPEPVQVCQDRYINGLDQEKPVIPTQKAYWTRTVSCGQPFRDYSNMKSTRLQPVKSNLPVQTFLPCSRKKGLFGHVVTKSRKAWQTMELYPTEISEVHQTYPGHKISIWACRECLGLPISKKNEVKILFFEWDIPVISFWLQIDYYFDWWDLQINKNWLQGSQTTDDDLVNCKLVECSKYKWLHIDNQNGYKS
jgi:hypothetical protein